MLLVPHTCSLDSLIIKWVTKANITNKKKIDIFDFIKVKNFYLSKDTIKRMEWEKAYATHKKDSYPQYINNHYKTLRKRQTPQSKLFKILE